MHVFTKSEMSALKGKGNDADSAQGFNHKTMITLLIEKIISFCLSLG